MSFKITGRTYNPRLNNTSSQEYIELENTVRNAIDGIFRVKVKGYIGVSDIRFSSGSVITMYRIGTNKVNSSDIQEANAAVVTTLQSYNVANTSFTAALIENTFENLSVVYSGDNMPLNCNPTVDKEAYTVTWKLNGKNITNDSKYMINDMISNLIVKNIITSESGTYECSVQIGVVQFIRKQYIAVQPAPAVFVKNEAIYIHCNETVELQCNGEAHNFSLEWIDESSQLLKSCKDTTPCKVNVSTIERKCLNGEEIKAFICKMTFRNKTITKEATVHFISNNVKFTCNDSDYGLGRDGDTAISGCVNDTEGRRAARCERGKWTFVNNSCLLPEIKELQLKSQVLITTGIPEFVEELYNVTNTSVDVVVISTANIIAVVDILTNIIKVIHGDHFNGGVIQNFLNTVDILVTEKTKLTWNILNNNTTTSRTGSKLLNSVEEIVKVIEETSITIPTSTMQLNKTTYSKNYSISYFNPTDEVMVLQSMPSSLSEITTVRFLTLDIVLLPRNLTSSNNTINGAVLLAYTNSPITNITLTFQIKNTALGNPQCVFWNFTEKAWDSSGCKVKNVGKENITCVCNHLTSFSILMSHFIPKAIRDILDYITYIGVGISMGSLVLCLIIEAIVWTAVTRNNISHMRHVTIVNIAVSLLIANIWFMIGAGISGRGETPVGPCSAATFFIHFFYLALFFWMLISGVLLFYHMVMVFSHMSKRVMMAISFTVGYGAPLIIAVITVAVTAPQKGYFRKDDACWLNWSETKALLAFVIPALAIVAINFIILIVVLYKLIRRGTGENQTDERNAVVVIARCIAVLTPFFGLTWGFGIGIMIEPQTVGLHIVFTVLNSLQGFFVLVFGILLDSRIRAALAGRFSFIHTSSNRTRSTSGGPSSSSGLGLFQRRGRRDAYHVSEAATSSQSNAASDSFLNT